MCVFLPCFSLQIGSAMSQVVENLFRAYVNGLLSDDELLLVMEAYLENRALPEPRRRLAQHGQFSLDGMSDAEVVQQFRFHREHLPLLLTSFGIPNVVNVDGCRVPGLTALCVLLRRLSYPNRLRDLERFFWLSKSAISSIAKWMVNHLIRRFDHLTQDLGRLPWLNPDKLAAYSEAVSQKGAPLNNVWAFIDGTARKTCRPTDDQNLFYSGHKRIHCLKYQSILTPDGLIVNLKGPFQGNRHDGGIWSGCGIQEQVRRLCVTRDRTFLLYGDPAYAVSDILIAPYPTTNHQPHAVAFNRAMSSVRQAVEWGFGKVIQQFAFVDFSKNQKLQLQNVGGMYRAAVLLTNCHTCLYGSQAAQYFGIDPPRTIELLHK